MMHGQKNIKLPWLFELKSLSISTYNLCICALKVRNRSKFVSNNNSKALCYRGLKNFYVYKKEGFVFPKVELSTTPVRQIRHLFIINIPNCSYMFRLVLSHPLVI
jgi:hypothetical protein